MLHFASLPAPVREAVFLRLRPSDLNESLKVCSGWKEFVEGEILMSGRNKVKKVVTTHRRTLGKIKEEKGQKVEVETLWMLASCDASEKMLYTLAKPSTGNDWPLKQYSVATGLKELNTVTLLTSNFIKNMEVVAGHLVLFKQASDNAANTSPAVFNLLSIPWGGRLPIENGMPLPSDAFHFTKLILGKDQLFVVSKNAHVTWTKGQGGAFTENTHETFAEDLERPVVVQRLTRMSGAWTDVAKIYPEHHFKVMEKMANIPNKEPNPKYKDDTCLLYLSSDIITERYLLVCCPLHGHYEMFDYVHDFSMWRLNMGQLPFDNVRSVIKDAQNDCSQVLAAVRDGYVFIYAEPGTATLVNVEKGEIMSQVKGTRFVLSPRYVAAKERRGEEGDEKKKNNVFDVTITDSTTGEAFPTVTLKRDVLSSDVQGDKPWYIDDEALGDFAGLARQLLPDGGPTWPVFQRKAVNYWGFGHHLLDAERMVFWQRTKADKFLIKTAELKLKMELDEEEENNREKMVTE